MEEPATVYRPRAPPRLHSSIDTSNPTPSSPPNALTHVLPVPDPYQIAPTRNISLSDKVPMTSSRNSSEPVISTKGLPLSTILENDKHHYVFRNPWVGPRTACKVLFRLTCLRALARLSVTREHQSESSTIPVPDSLCLGLQETMDDHDNLTLVINRVEPGKSSSNPNVHPLDITNQANTRNWCYQLPIIPTVTMEGDYIIPCFVTSDQSSSLRKVVYRFIMHLCRSDFHYGLAQPGADPTVLFIIPRGKPAGTMDMNFRQLCPKYAFDILPSTGYRIRELDTFTTGLSRRIQMSARHSRALPTLPRNPLVWGTLAIEQATVEAQLTFLPPSNHSHSDLGNGLWLYGQLDPTHEEVHRQCLWWIKRMVHQYPDENLLATSFPLLLITSFDDFHVSMSSLSYQWYTVKCDPQPCGFDLYGFDYTVTNLEALLAPKVTPIKRGRLTTSVDSLSDQVWNLELLREETSFWEAEALLTGLTVPLVDIDKSRSVSPPSSPVSFSASTLSFSMNEEASFMATSTSSARSPQNTIPDNPASPPLHPSLVADRGPTGDAWLPTFSKSPVSSFPTYTTRKVKVNGVPPTLSNKSDTSPLDLDTNHMLLSQQQQIIDLLQQQFQLLSKQVTDAPVRQPTFPLSSERYLPNRSRLASDGPSLTTLPKQSLAPPSYWTQEYVPLSSPATTRSVTRKYLRINGGTSTYVPRPLVPHRSTFTGSDSDQVLPWNPSSRVTRHPVVPDPVQRDIVFEAYEETECITHCPTYPQASLSVPTASEGCRRPPTSGLTSTRQRSRQPSYATTTRHDRPVSLGSEDSVSQLVQQINDVLSFTGSNQRKSSPRNISGQSLPDPILPEGQLRSVPRKDAQGKLSIASPTNDQYRPALTPMTKKHLENLRK
ncbi:hypothetical protein IWQ61_004250 [Dispira simplex]|nr:hypothetical protein IWQ61_004250 [Dispira simplex]